jgi:hypothetical protein
MSVNFEQKRALNARHRITTKRRIGISSWPELYRQTISANHRNQLTAEAIYNKETEN